MIRIANVASTFRRILGITKVSDPFRAAPYTDHDTGEWQEAERIVEWPATTGPITIVSLTHPDLSDTPA